MPNANKYDIPNTAVTEIFPDMELAFSYWKVNPSVINFIIYQIYNENNKWVFEKEGTDYSGEYTEDVKEAKALYQGFLRFDECFHMYPLDDFYHADGVKQASAIGEVIKEIFAVAANIGVIRG